jgi:hypothetical protein
MELTVKTIHAFLSLLALGTLVALAGCSSRTGNSQAEVSAFAGDPAAKARAGAEIRERARQNAAASMAGAQAKAQANTPKGAPAR